MTLLLTVQNASFRSPSLLVFEHRYHPRRREHSLPRRNAAEEDLRTAGSCRTPSRVLRAATRAATGLRPTASLCATACPTAGLRPTASLCATACPTAGLRATACPAAGLRATACPATGLRATACPAEGSAIRDRDVVAQHLAIHKEQKLIY